MPSAMLHLFATLKDRLPHPVPPLPTACAPFWAFLADVDTSNARCIIFSMKTAEPIPHCPLPGKASHLRMAEFNPILQNT